ncbi:MAG TPA: sodium:calcium antiporter [Acidimicrobiia bacterium]|nr:sodium:calcium antiporter [Acidimicrobiia bacterium]
MVYFILFVGILFAATGGEFFVRGSIGVAAWIRIPSGIVGSTIAAFATSSPELSVSVVSANDGKPEIALGSALGSNIANICLIFAIAILLLPMRTSKKELKRDLPFAITAPIVIGLFGLDGTITRLDGLIIIVFFATWLSITIAQTLKKRSDSVQVLGEESHGKSLLQGSLGLVLLVLAGFLIVYAAEEIGGILSWNPFLVGATLVALGTSTPELATTVVARIKGHDELGVGTVIGSNIFNALLVVGCAALIQPISIDNKAEFLTGVGFGVFSMMLIIPGAKSLLGRQRAVALLLLYGVYLFLVINL